MTVSECNKLKKLSQHKRIILASTIGTFVEFYDFTLYGFFATLIAQLFFPSANPVVSLFMTYGVFAVSFLGRPLGAIILGYIGDLFGRVKALTLSILCMGIPTIAIGLLPTYEQIGFYAPLILILMRFLQGVCTGGEYNGAFIFAFEHRRSQEGFLGGLISASAVFGMIFAITTSLIVIKFFPQEYAWRIPFLLGSVIAIFGYFIRRYIVESPEFIKSREKASTSIIKQVYGFFKKSPLPFIVTFWIGATSGAMFYYQYIFLNDYCIKYLGINMETVTALNTVIMVFYAIMLPLFGAISDRVGHYVISMLSALICCILIIATSLFLQQVTSMSLVITRFILSVLTAGFIAPSHIIMKKAFPTPCRYFAVSLSFSLGMSIFGGTTPIVCTWLNYILDISFAPALYIFFICLITFIFLRVASQQSIAISEADIRLAA